MLLDPFGVRVYPCPKEVVWEEVGETFRDNALIKARAVYDFLTGLNPESSFAVLADDSGLVVEGLDGQPGVFSARYAGVESSDEANNRKLVLELQLKHLTQSPAYFVCEICFFSKTRIEFFRGEVHGKVLTTPSGQGGFGYDPYFYVEQVQKMMAELTLAEKNNLSHRALAVKKFKNFLRSFFAL